MINNEFTSQVTRKFEELKEGLKSQILEVISSTIAEKVLPSVQNILGILETEQNTKVDHMPCGLNGSSNIILLVGKTGKIV